MQEFNQLLWPLFIMGGIALVSLISGYLSYRKRQDRDALLVSYAGSNGFNLQRSPPSEPSWFEQFVPRKLHPLASHLIAFYPFNEGSFERIDNLLTKQIGDTCVYAFDYHTLTERTDSDGDKQQHRNQYGVVAMKLGLLWPYLRLSPEHFGHRIIKLAGSKELALESEEFNRMYFVQTDDPKAADDVLHPQAVDYLLRNPPRDWQFGNMYLLVVSPLLMSPQEISRVITEMREFVELVPGYVKQDRSFQPKWTGPLDL